MVWILVARDLADIETATHMNLYGILAAWVLFPCLPSTNIRVSARQLMQAIVSNLQWTHHDVLIPRLPI